MKSLIAGRDGEVAPSAERTPLVRWALACLSLSTLLSSLGTSIANVGLPTLARVFNASFQDVQWVVLAYLLAITTLIVSVGRLGDITGRRRLLLAGIFLFTMASVLCGVAPTLWLLIVARAAQGLGAAIMMALTMAFVAETVPKERTGSAMGLLGTMSAIGTALLNLSRNLGLITGASVMGAVFALASATTDITTAPPEAVATGLRMTFGVATMLIVVALAIAVGTYRPRIVGSAPGPEEALLAAKNSG